MTGVCSVSTVSTFALLPRFRAGLGKPRFRPFNDSGNKVTSTSTIPDNFGFLELTAARNRRRRQR